MRHQQPATASLLNVMEIYACRRLCHLVKEGMCVVQHDRTRSGVDLQLFAQNVRIQPQARAGDLNICAGRSMTVSEDYRKANNPFVTNSANLCSRAVCHCADERGDALDWEIDERDILIRFVKGLAVLERHRFEVRPQPVEIRWLQQLQQTISVGLARLVHDPILQVVDKLARNWR